MSSLHLVAGSYSNDCDQAEVVENIILAFPPLSCNMPVLVKENYNKKIEKNGNIAQKYLNTNKNLVNCIRTKIY